MGIRNLVVAVNKMDLVQYEENFFQKIDLDFQKLSRENNLKKIQIIPISAVQGINIIENNQKIPWYSGPSLLEYLDQIHIKNSLNDIKEKNSQTIPFRMPVQQVIRPNESYRGFSGRITSGLVSIGDSVTILPSGVKSRVRSIDFWNNSMTNASKSASITLTLEDEVDISRGDVICGSDDSPQIADQFQVELIWMSKEPLIPGRRYLLRLNQQEVNAQVTRIRFKEEIETGKHLAAERLELNEIAQINLSTNQPVVFEPYSTNRIMGGLILIDRMNFDTLGAGII
jgi:GTPases - Sulfate adenylate transferase subunit 1